MLLAYRSYKNMAGQLWPMVQPLLYMVSAKLPVDQAYTDR